MDLDTVLSPEWLTVAISETYPGTRVESTIIVERIDTIATKVRFTAQYLDRPVEDVPESLCVKGYFLEESAHYASLGAREARFYDELAGIVPVRHPRCVYAATDSSSGHGIVIMEDLVTGGARFLTALSPYTPAQVAASLEQLAQLHASHWDDPDIAARRWLDPTFAGYSNALPESKLSELLSGPRGEFVPPGIRNAGRLKAAVAALGVRLADRPTCIVHADAHAGNLYEDMEGKPGLVDWQMYQRASWSLDVAYHVGSVLDPSVRESNERDLLHHYLEELRSAGADAPTPEQAWEDYRASLAYGYFLWAITQRVEPDITNEFNRRLGSAVAAHGSLDILGV
jgi:hypothetical protein